MTIIDKDVLCLLVRYQYFSINSYTLTVPLQRTILETLYFSTFHAIFLLFSLSLQIKEGPDKGLDTPVRITEIIIKVPKKIA